MSIYAIGDLQGCYFSLQSLLDTLSFNKEEDELWFVGDLVNRGKGSLEVLDWCYKNQRNIKVVLGNHDLHFLSVALRAKSISNNDTIETILKSKNLSKYIDWLLSLPLVHSNENFLMVHAGIPPSWSSEYSKKLSNELTLELNKNPKKFLENMYGNFPNKWDKNYKKKDRLRFTINSFTRMRVLNKDGSMNFSFKKMHFVNDNLVMLASARPGALLSRFWGSGLELLQGPMPNAWYISSALLLKQNVNKQVLGFSV